MRLRRVLGLLLVVAGVVVWVLQARRSEDEWVGVDLGPELRPAPAARAEVAPVASAAGPAADAAVEAGAEAVVEAPAATGEVDDLTRIDGIGPKTAAALAAAGLGTFAALADASEDALRAALRAAGARASANLPTWAAQARALAG